MNAERWARRALACVASVGVVLLSGGAAAAVPPDDGLDFDPRSQAWNGLSYLVATAAEARVELSAIDHLDWSDLDVRTTLMLVAPRVGPRVGDPSLARFLAAGGRLIVADDFRSGYAWLRSVGIELRSRPGPADEHVGDLRFLPRFALADLGPYLDFHDRRAGRDPAVVLNHPGSLAVAASPPAGMRPRIRGWFSDRARGWLAEVRGDAKAMAIADSSVFINAMMRGFYGNKQLAANTLRYFCYAGEPCRVRLVANLAHITGSFDAAAADSDPGMTRDPRQALRGAADRIATLLARPDFSLLWCMAILATLAAPVVTASRTPKPLLPPRTVVGRTRTRLHDTVRAWLATRDADYRRPARQLANHLAVTIAAALPAGTQHARGAEQRGRPPAIGDLPALVDRLVRAGRLSTRAAGRIGTVVSELRTITGSEPSEMDRRRFTLLAAEVEWAEQVLLHTHGGDTQQSTRYGPNTWSEDEHGR